MFFLVGSRIFSFKPHVRGCGSGSVSNLLAVKASEAGFRSPAPPQKSQQGPASLKLGKLEAEGALELASQPASFAQSVSSTFRDPLKRNKAKDD